MDGDSIEWLMYRISEYNRNDERLSESGSTIRCRASGFIGLNSHIRNNVGVCLLPGTPQYRNRYHWRNWNRFSIINSHTHNSLLT